jgi:hypothetical protein
MTTTEALNVLTATVYGLQRQMGDFIVRLSAIESAQPSG